MDNITLDIKEVSESLSEFNMPVYYKYRYTFDRNEDDDSSRKHMFEMLFKYIKANYVIGDKMTGGIEYYTKGMMACKPHCHIHFISRHKSDTIRKGIMRQFNLIGRCQSCKPEVLVDEKKFWRYPLKQQQNDSAICYRVIGFDKQEIKDMMNVAYECWKQSAEVTLGKLQKKEEKTSKDRLFQYLENIAFESEKQLKICAYKYYVEYEDTFSYNVVDGYVDIFMLLRGYISYEDFYDRKH